MKTTDYRLAEIGEYRAVRRFVTRKEMRLSRDFEKSLEWRHMEKLHDYRIGLADAQGRMRTARGGPLAVADNSFWTGGCTQRTWLHSERRHILCDDSGLPCDVNGIDVPERLRKTLDLVLTHGRKRHFSIISIMCDNSMKYAAARQKYYRNIRELLLILGQKRQSRVTDSRFSVLDRRAEQVPVRKKQRRKP